MDERNEQSPFTISIRDGGLECEVTVHAGFDPESTGEALCLNALREATIQISPEVSKRVVALLTLHETDINCAHSLVIVKGELPEHGEDGRLELEPKFDPDVEVDDELKSDDSSEDDRTDAASEDGVDYRDRSAFALVEVGERIGTLHPPKPGIDGRSVTGETIPAKQGKPVVLNVDESVLVRDNGSIESAMSGVVQIEGRKLRVLQKLEIHGSVDFSTGNVNFPGDVSVNKSVKDCFRVEARRDIEIRGLVEAASIHAGRDLHLHGGAACREKGELFAERDIEARYLNECDVKAGRRLVVKNEVISANIAVGADMISPNCTIIGGTSYITGACEIAELGSERNIPTVVTLGRERDANQLADQAQSLLQTIRDRLGKNQVEHDQLKKNAAKLTPTQAEHMTELQFEIGTCERLDESLSGAVDGLDKAVEAVATINLTVQKQMWRGVTILLGDWEAVIDEPIKGPFKITCNSAGKPILTDLLSNSSVELSKVATVRSRIEDEGADEAIAA